MCNTNTPQVVVFALALSGYAYLWLAIVVDVGSMLAVTLNGLTLLKPEEKRKKTCGGGKAHGHGHGHSHGGEGHGHAHGWAGHGHAHGKKAACAAAVVPTVHKKKKSG